jgi:cystathionine gamma-synthase
MGDIIGYEEKVPEIRAKMRSGYPRFFENRLITRFRKHLQQKHDLQGKQLFLFPSATSHAEWLSFSPLANLELIDGGDWLGVPMDLQDETTLTQIRAFQQHTGALLSSRQAEDALVREGLLVQAHAEERYSGEPAAADFHIREHLHHVYKTQSPEDVILFRGGMSAFFAGFRALQSIQKSRGRDIWIQLGWLYVDTIRIIEKWNPGEQTSIFHYNACDLDGLQEIITQSGNRLAGVITELPTNPLLQTTDLPRLRAMCDRAGAALILDPTMASPHNVNILPYSDLHINSLTKYAGHAGDVMMGALGLNAQSAFYPELKDRIRKLIQPPYRAELQRMAYLIDHYGQVVKDINHNTLKVVEVLEKHPKVEKVWWAGENSSQKNFEQIRQPNGGPGAMISFKLKVPIADFYGRLKMAKSPSFGTSFSMICPFLYLAHYDLVSSAEGRQQLEANGIPPELLRLSTGTEPVDEILGVLNEALAG